MKLYILAVGNKMPDWVLAGFMEYTQRMPREIPIHLIEIKPDKRGSKQNEQLLLAESERIQAAIPSACYIVVMDERGKQFTTIQLAETLIDWMRNGKDVVFIIGYFPWHTLGIFHKARSYPSGHFISYGQDIEFHYLFHF